MATVWEGSVAWCGVSVKSRGITAHAVCVIRGLSWCMCVSHRASKGLHFAPARTARPRKDVQIFLCKSVYYLSHIWGPAFENLLSHLRGCCTTCPLSYAFVRVYSTHCACLLHTGRVAQASWCVSRAVYVCVLLPWVESHCLLKLASVRM